MKRVRSISEWVRYKAWMALWGWLKKWILKMIKGMGKSK